MLPYDKMHVRVEKARADKVLWEDNLRECYRYALPERNTIDKWSRGAKKDEWVFDSTAIDALEDYATRMESELVPTNTQWIKLESGSDVPKENSADVNKYLEETTDVLFQNITSSNFSSQVHEAFLDLGISTGALIVEDGDGIQSSLNFRAVSLSELLIERSDRGLIETAWRDFKVPASDITTIWSRAKIGSDLEEIIANKPETEISLIEGIVKVEGGFESVLMYPEKKEYLIQETLESSSWVIFRESSIAGESYGRGRVMRCLRDIKTLNLMVEDHLKAASFTANPIFTAMDDGVINPYTVSLEPGAIIPVNSNSNTNPSLRPLDQAGRYDVLQYDIRALQDNIRRIMLSKPFGNIEETPVRTATEMSIRNAELAKTSVGASGRIQNELLERIVTRCMYLLKSSGKVAPMRVNGKEVAIRFTSPSSRQQDEFLLAAYGRFMEIMAGFPPELVNNSIKMEDIPKNIAEILGLPPTIIRTDMEKQQLQQQQAIQQQQLQQQMATEEAQK